jgi:hypothetical protein
MTFEELIKQRKDRTMFLARAYSLAADRARRLHLGVGIPLIALSGIAGAASLANLAHVDQHGPILLLATTVASVMAGILASLQTFLDFGGEARAHAATKQRLYALNRRIDHLSFIKGEDEMLVAIRQFDDALDKVMEDAPKAPMKLHIRAQQKIQLREG